MSHESSRFEAHLQCQISHTKNIHERFAEVNLHLNDSIIYYRWYRMGILDLRIL
jgi:hypothetical protein